MKGNVERKPAPLGPVIRSRTRLGYFIGCHSRFPIVGRSDNHCQRSHSQLPISSLLFLGMLTWVFEVICVLIASTPPTALISTWHLTLYLNCCFII